VLVLIFSVAMLATVGFADDNSRFRAGDFASAQKLVVRR
jgi:hypothetical protein